MGCLEVDIFLPREGLSSNLYVMCVVWQPSPGGGGGVMGQEYRVQISSPANTEKESLLFFFDFIVIFEIVKIKFKKYLEKRKRES